MLKNPLSSPLSGSFAGSIFDEVYVVHPFGSDIEQLADLLELTTPIIGLVVVEPQRNERKSSNPKQNPFLSEEMKTYFLEQLETLESYTKFKVNPVQ